MNHNKEAKKLSFWRGSEVRQVRKIRIRTFSTQVIDTVVEVQQLRLVQVILLVPLPIFNLVATSPDSSDRFLWILAKPWGNPTNTAEVGKFQVGRRLRGLAFGSGVSGKPESLGFCHGLGFRV